MQTANTAATSVLRNAAFEEKVRNKPCACAVGQTSHRGEGDCKWLNTNTHDPSILITFQKSHRHFCKATTVFF